MSLESKKESFEIISSDYQEFKKFLLKEYEIYIKRAF